MCSSDLPKPQTPNPKPQTPNPFLGKKVSKKEFMNNEEEEMMNDFRPEDISASANDIKGAPLALRLKEFNNKKKNNQLSIIKKNIPKLEIAPVRSEKQKQESLKHTFSFNFEEPLEDSFEHRRNSSSRHK